jgi:C4-dicarboxylate-specific signal transduction histidine kinase
MLSGTSKTVPPNAHILVVDDDPVNRVLLDAVLSPEGYRVTEADSGEQALARLAEGGVDLVLLDMMMPGIDGAETCARLRQLPGCRTLPVVFITAYGDRQARLRAKEAGADEFLTKPLDEAELLVRVRTLLAAKAFHDLREQQRELLERELERRAELLLRAERLATLGTLAGAVGHELNNANMVFNFTLAAIERRASEGAPPAAEDLAALRKVFTTVRLHASQLLSLGRPGPDRVEMVDLGELLRELSTTLRAIGRIKHIALTLDLPDEGVCLLANRTRVEQVFLNLLVNAADALSDRSDRPREIVVRARALPGDRVECRVEDTGCGIPEAALGQIFEPYFTTKAPGQGTGLGLPVVQQIVQSYQGTVRAESRQGVGTAFVFDLPGY